jgi:hypothetical protein
MEMDQLRHRRPRSLTFDEKRAAEAAFAGEPPCSAWSEAGQRVYEGLIAALYAQAGESLSSQCEEWQMSRVKCLGGSLVC